MVVVFYVGFSPRGSGEEGGEVYGHDVCFFGVLS